MILWRISIFREIQEERDFCVIMLIQTNIENRMTVRKDTASGKVGDDQ